MKEKYFSLRFIILTIILFTCFFIFSSQSLALIPGDFGRAGGGSPDGCVDFEDLMIFALAYGSTPFDANWNPLCDIYSDDVIDFEDLMIFAMNYGKDYTIKEMKAIAITTPYSLEPVTPPVPASSIIGLVDKINRGEEKDQVLRDIKLEQSKGRDDETDYAVLIYWNAILEGGQLDENVDYKVYRSVDGINYENIASDDNCYLDEVYSEEEECIIIGADIAVDPDLGLTYSYYVTTYGSGWETKPSQIVTVDTWLPSCCSLNSPPEGSSITDPNPAFSWNPLAMSNFPYGSISTGESDLWVYDNTEYAQAWWITFHDFTTSAATYNQDGLASPLTPGHDYYWNSYSYGYDLNSNLIALSLCEPRYFNYRITEGVVSNVQAVAVTSKMGYEEHYIEISYSLYPKATSYKIYRSVNGENYELLPSTLCKEFPSNNNWHLLEGFVSPVPPPFRDYDVFPSNTYSYYVIACGDGWETAPSEIATVDTWLPLCSLISPSNNFVVTVSDPTFIWDSGEMNLPHGSISSGKSHLFVYSQSYPFIFWSISFVDPFISSATYNQDGEADPLEIGNRYDWHIATEGYNENGQLIAKSESENWDFQYGAVVSDIEARAYTCQGTSMEMFQEKLDKLIAEGQIQDSYKLNELPSLAKRIAEYEISVDWHAYPYATGYKVYRSVNGGSYGVVFQDESTSGYDWYGFYDHDVSEGNTYAYYVTAYGTGWETDPSPTVTIDTFLPPCSLVSPADESIITDPTPTFTWNPVGISSFPYGSIVSGGSSLSIWFESGGIGCEWYWFDFNNLTTSSATYNQDGQAAPLETGNNYTWEVHSYGFGENGELIAYCWSEVWDFTYSEN